MYIKELEMSVSERRAWLELLVTVFSTASTIPVGTTGAHWRRCWAPWEWITPGILNQRKQRPSKIYKTKMIINILPITKRWMLASARVRSTALKPSAPVAGPPRRLSRSSRTCRGESVLDVFLWQCLLLWKAKSKFGQNKWDEREHGPE